MALETQITAKIVAWFDRSSFSNAIKEAEQELKKAEWQLKIKLGADFSSLKEIEKEINRITGATKDGVKIKITPEIDAQAMNKAMNVTWAWDKSVKIKITPEIDLTEERKQFSKLQDTARDTGVKINQELRAKLQIDIAGASLAIKQIRSEIKQETDKEKLIKLNVEAGAVQKNLTEIKRQFNNLDAVGNTAVSRLQRKFDWLGQTISNSISWLWGKISWVFGGAWWETASIFGWIWDSIASVWAKAWPVWMILWALWAAAWAIWWVFASLWDRLQQTTISFSTMLWSSSKAKDMLMDLWNLASKTPFEITWLRDTAKQLMAFWIENEKIIPTLKSLWDVAAGLSVPIEQIAYAYWQVRTANQLYGTELRQFVNAWVPLLSELAKMFWVNEAEVKNMVEAGKVWFVDVEKAFQNMSWEWWKFANLMQQQSTTLKGTISNIKDTFTLFWESFWATILPAIQVVANWFSSLANMLRWDVVPASQALNDSMDTSAIYTQQLYWEVTKLDNQIESLSQKYNEWSISIEEYARQQAKLLLQKDELLSKIDEEKARQKDLNDSYIESQEEQKRLEERLVSFQKELDSLSGKQNIDINEKKSLEIGIWKLIEWISIQRKKQKELTDEIENWNNANARYELSVKKVSSAEWELGNIIDSLKTTKSQAEFDALKAKKIEMIHTNAKAIKSEFELQRVFFKSWKISESQYVQFWKSATDALKNLQKLESEAKKVSFVAPKTGSDKKTWWGWKSQAEKDREEAEKEKEKQTENLLKEEEKYQLDKMKIEEKAREDEKKKEEKRKEDIKKLQGEIIDAYYKKRDVQKDVDTKAIDDQKKLIDEATKNIEDYVKKLEDIKKEIEWVTTWWQEDVAKRAVDIEKELIDLAKEKQDLENQKTESTDTTEQEKINQKILDFEDKNTKLQAELKLAQENTTLANIEEARKLSTETETERIIRETAEKKAELEIQKADLETKIANEQLLLQEAQTKKIDLEKSFTEAYKQEIKTREDENIASLDRQISKAREAISLLRQAGTAIPNTWTATSAWWTTTNSTSNTYNIANPAAAQVIVNRTSNPSAL